ncbi:MAG: RNA polymerase sigma-70 factor, partial [Bacteroides sp.]
MNHTTDICTDERDLLVRLIGGDEEAFCELYARYKSRLLYFALKFVKSRDFAEDIFQDTFAVV